MKKIGIIGGLGWPSTIDYYRLLCMKTNAYFERTGHDRPLPTPHILIESLDMSQTRRLRGVEGDDSSWLGFEAVFRETFERLQGAGADFGIIASNTPHMRINGIVRGLNLKVLSILDATAREASKQRAGRALVLGTTVTMNSPMYSDILNNYGIGTVPSLSDDEIQGLGRIIDEDLYQGRIGSSREYVLDLSKRYVGADGDVVCLACTELSLAFPEHQDEAHFSYDGISFLNTTVAHVEAALAESIDE